MRSVSLLFCLTLLFAACSNSDTPTDAEERPDPRVAEVDLEIGVVEGDEPYMFGSISGATADDRGRVYVADRQNHEIRVFGPEGTFLFAIGGPGEGPGELDRPCCLAFGPNGHLWVRDDQNRRYNRYRLEDDGAVPDGQIGMEHTHAGLLAATTFDDEGRLIDVGGKRTSSSLNSRTVRFHRTLDEETVHEQFIPEPPEGRIPMYEAEIRGGVVRMPQPQGPRAQHAHSPDGDWAFTITDRYEVVRFTAEGDTLHVIERSARGPELSADERERAEEGLRWQVDQLDASLGDLPYGVPDRKPPLRRIFFDEDGRLWVQRSVADGAPNEADVYDRDGELVDVVQWPSGVMLHLGTVRDGVAHGIRSGGGDDVDRVVRLRF